MLSKHGSRALLGLLWWVASASATTAQESRASEAETVVLTEAGLVVERSCVVRVPEGLVVSDSARKGVVVVAKDDVAVTFTGDVLRGAADGRPPETFEGYGVRVEGRRGVRIEGLRARGFRAGIYATRADGLVVANADLSDNRAQRLRSTPTRCDDASDWLSPHDNDANEWLERYGAGLYVEDSKGVAVSNARVRRTQNGIVFDRVDGSSVVDCDTSFLSGFGLAMWRSSENVVSRNAFDFCVRGYSHGVYNRGQDSAGILMFEQCRRNRIVLNSITHGGDGVFGFAGREALGERGPMDLDRQRRGCDDNVFFGNDLSFAAAHGLEMTFSFGNRVEANLFEGNAICGIWAGYSQDSQIVGNAFVGNGDRGYGLERGGVNIEHGSGNRVEANDFSGDRCGVHLWGRNGGALRDKPWGRANPQTKPETVASNTFRACETAVHLRGVDGVALGPNVFDACAVEVSAEDATTTSNATSPCDLRLPEDAPGTKTPVGAHPALRGRDKIVMTPYGPWDHERPVARLDSDDGGDHVWRVFGADRPKLAGSAFGADAPFRVDVLSGDAASGVPFVVRALRDGAIPYAFRVEVGGDAAPLSIEGLVLKTKWRVAFFPWAADPRVDEAAFRGGAKKPGAVETTTSALAFRFDGGGPSDVVPDPAVRAAKLPKDRFGLLASTTLRLPKGRYRATLRSDDGVRLKIDGSCVVDAWTWHPPQTDVALFDVAEERDVAFDLAYFEIDGHAVLEFALERIEDG
jgi:nitrous oxidase accessory protein NosD